MKKILANAIFLAALMLCNDLAFSASGASSGRVKTIYWYEGHTGVLLVQEGMSDLGGCGRSDFYILDDQHPYFRDIYALILSAHIAGQPLSLAINGCAQGISRISNILSTK